MTPVSNASGPESIVVSLECAKKLKDAGWPQDDFVFFFAVIEHKHGHAGSVHLRENYGEQTIQSIMKAGGLLAAPTDEEILCKLPEYFDDAEMKDGIYKRFWLIAQKDGDWTVCYSDGKCMIKKGVGPMRVSADSLAEAAAKMYVFLAEHNLLQPQ